MKRHVKAVHGMDAYRGIECPDIYGRVYFAPFSVADNSLTRKSINDLRKEAKHRGVSPLGKSRKALVIELSNNMDIVAPADASPEGAIRPEPAGDGDPESRAEQRMRLSGAPRPEVTTIVRV